MGERVIRETEPYEMSPEQEAAADAAIEAAERDIAEMQATGRWGFSEDAVPVERGAAARAPEEAKVTMRWSRAQLDVVR